MNKKERRQLSGIIAELDALKMRVEEMATKEQDKFDNMSEGLQATANGRLIEEIASQLAECAETIEAAMDTATEAETNA